jgi:hypothetical protein
MTAAPRGAIVGAMRVQLRFLLLAVVLVVAGVAWFVGRDGGSIVLDPVAQAASTTNAGSFRFTLSASNAGTGDLHGAGAYDADRKRLQIGFDVPYPTGGSMRMDVITDTSDGAVVYARFPLAPSLPSGKTWMKVDVEKLAKGSGLDLTQLLQANQGSPAPVLDALVKTNESTKVGRETIDGVATTHYRSAVDPREAALSQFRGDARKQLEQALQTTHVASIPVDAWVGDDGLVRRLRLELPSDVTGRSTGGTITFTEELSGYGDDVDVELPDESEVFDFSSIHFG